VRFNTKMKTREEIIQEIKKLQTLKQVFSGDRNDEADVYIYALQWVIGEEVPSE
jgi:hypothetical protein